MTVIDVAITPRDVAGSVDACVVIDCIRAATVAAVALNAGCPRIYCVTKVRHAFALRAGPASGGLLGGERGGLAIQGFDLGNSPREYAHIDAVPLVLCTTNGTAVLVDSARRAALVVFGSMVNMAAVVDHVETHDPLSIRIVCAGAAGAATLDDAYVAGRYVDAFRSRLARPEITDGARVASAIVEAYGHPWSALKCSSSAAALARLGLKDDVRFCAQDSVLATVPVVERGHPGHVELIDALIPRPDEGRLEAAPRR